MCWSENYRRVDFSPHGGENVGTESKAVTCDSGSHSKDLL